jgi:hypothetical protein
MLKKSLPIPPQTDYGFDEKEQKFATTQQVHAWHDVKRGIDTKLKAKYVLNYQQKAIRLYYQFVEAGIIDRHFGTIADTLTTGEDLADLIAALRQLAFRFEDESAPIPVGRA